MSKKAEVQSVILNKQIVNSLRASASKLNSRQISNKTTEAREALVNQNFNTIFEKELKFLRKEHIKVNMDFGTAKGNSQVKQKIQSCALTDILSEGEQKAIALAEFLTELQLDKSSAPVVFDDPVNSLDHNIIDDVSKRLIRLSMDRQVVVFTHSILLFNSFIQRSELHVFKNLQYKYYETQTDLQLTGYLHPTTDGKKETFRSYEKQINAILALPKEERSQNENDLAVNGYGKLRAAIEVVVEEDILKNLVRRYRKNVAMTALEKVDGKLIDECKDEINDVFERCCGYIDGHSNPEELSSKPSLLELQKDLDTIKGIQAKFKPNG